MLSCLLLVPQLSAASLAWYTVPVVLDPHPVRYSYWASYHELYAERTTGLRASPVFREPMAASTVYYTMWSLTGEQPYTVEQATQEHWRDTAFSSASIAAEALLWETVGRSDELDGALRLMRTFVSPNLELRRGDEGWSARANHPEIRMRSQLERRELREGMFERRGEPVPTISLGTGMDIEELDALTDRERTVDAAAWLRMQHLGLDMLTVRGLLLSRTWELSGRQHIVRGLSLAAAVSSRPASTWPDDWGTGVSWALPGLRWWTVALRYRRDFALLPADEQEWNVRLTLRWLPPARAPVLPGGWPLGPRPAAPGPVRPAPVRVLPPQAESALPEPPAEQQDEPREPRRRGRRVSGSCEEPR